MSPVFSERGKPNSAIQNDINLAKLVKYIQSALNKRKVLAKQHLRRKTRLRV